MSGLAAVARRGVTRHFMRPYLFMRWDGEVHRAFIEPMSLFTAADAIQQSLVSFYAASFSASLMVSLSALRCRRRLWRCT